VYLFIELRLFFFNTEVLKWEFIHAGEVPEGKTVNLRLFVGADLVSVQKIKNICKYRADTRSAPTI